ncbi:hypothetical protein D3P06_17890 [Paracoccus aestuarii]|uniref:DUF2497 domain-containing protein n=1 Tax=Paracoccus aestuarii TaxID=453842 RepID=A0A418ZPN2_9RHOB|nr:hypothetical protein [Paracoccus aestuarii]RJK96210.1 hypothetical protein D3P06_17890 [Paracoccus aestuarii]WCQ99955.1 hypothetical protein JHW48_04335 [Paracoccus aestuarii]
MAEARRTPAPDAEVASPRRKAAAPRSRKPKADAAAKPAPKTPAKRKPKAATPAAVERPAVGGAAAEIAQIRSGVAQIRRMLDDAPPLPPMDAHELLTRLCRDPAPRPHRSAGAQVIDLVPHMRLPAEDEAAADLPDIRDEVQDGGVAETGGPGDGPRVPVQPEVPGIVMPVRRSRIARLLSAWGDWLMWRLMPPEIANAPAAQQPAAPQPVTEAAPAVIQITAPPVPIDEIVAEAIARITADGTLRDHLQEMIREDLEGEMGARFSGNLRTVLRREISVALDDRLTHL